MKKLSDYQGEEAIDLWGDLLDPITKILGDPEIAKVVQSGAPKMTIVKTVLLEHKAEAEEILLRIDPEPLNGLNLIVRLLSVVVELGSRDDIRGFFGYAAQGQKDSEFSGSPMENTEDAEN